MIMSMKFIWNLISNNFSSLFFSFLCCLLYSSRIFQFLIKFVPENRRKKVLNTKTMFVCHLLNVDIKWKVFNIKWKSIFSPCSCYTYVLGVCSVLANSEHDNNLSKITISTSFFIRFIFIFSTVQPQNNNNNNECLWNFNILFLLLKSQQFKCVSVEMP